MEIRIVEKSEASDWVHSLHMTKPSIALGMLLAGDRWSCVEKAAIAEIDNKIVGIATMAPKGEEISGQPTIVAIYVLHGHRGQGIGFQLLQAAIDWMLAQGLEPIRLDVLNSKIMAMIACLSAEKQQKLNVVDQSGSTAFDAMMEM